MQKRIAIKMSQSQWPEAMSTVRNMKSKGYLLTVFDLGLSPEAKDKLQDLKVFLSDLSGSVYDLSLVTGEGERCFVGMDDPESYLSAKGLVCRANGAESVSSAMIPAANIQKRAEAANWIEKAIVDKYGGLLSPESLCGGKEDWEKYAGFFRFLNESGYFQPIPSGEKMALNLYAVFFPENVTVLEQ